jgi:hypothetical protein
MLIIFHFSAPANMVAAGGGGGGGGFIDCL